LKKVILAVSVKVKNGIILSEFEENTSKCIAHLCFSLKKGPIRIQVRIGLTHPLAS
jgi:hypothetical protein